MMLVAIAAIYLPGHLAATGEFDADGNAKVRMIPKIVNPGTLFDCDEALSEEFLFSDAVRTPAARLPSEQELQLEALAARGRQ